MTKGKYANTAEARRAREQAIAEADASKRHIATLEADLASLAEQNAALKLERDQAVTAVVEKLRRDLNAERAATQACREVLACAEKGMLSVYEELVRLNVARGLGVDAAISTADGVMSEMLVRGEWLPVSQIAVWWDRSTLKVDRIAPRKQSLNRGHQWVLQRTADKHSAADARQAQVGE